jgi:hypothetical protein
MKKLTKAEQIKLGNIKEHLAFLKREGEQVNNELLKLVTARDKERDAFLNEKSKNEKEIAALNEKLSELKTLSEQEMRKINNERQALEIDRKNFIEYTKQEEERLSTERAKLKESEIVHIDKVQKLIRQKEIISQEIEKLEADKDFLIKVLSQKEEAIKNLDSVREMLRDAESRLSSVTNEIEVKKIDGEKIISEAEEKAHKIISDAYEKNKEILDRAKYLAELEERLRTKEADLLIIESRWKKLYEEKGASFKV